MSTELGAGRGPAGSRGADVITFDARHAGRFTVLRAAAMFDGVSSELRAMPSVVIADGVIAAVHGPGGHCHFLGGAASGQRGLRAAVRERAERGVDVIKVMASGGNLTPGSLAHEPQFDAESLRAIVDEAHRLGLPVTVHAHSARSIADAVAAGVNGIEHATFMTADGVYAPEALIRAIAAQQIAVGWTVGLDPDHAGSAPPQIASRMAALGANRRRLHESGAMLVAGSDAGVWPAKPHDVLPYATEDLAAAGLSPAEILRTMTSRAAQACGLGHRKGRIAPGLDADLIAIDGNPLDDLAAVRRRRAVYAAGRAVRPDPGPPGQNRGPVMPRPAPGPAPGQAPSPVVEPHLLPLAGEWALWRDIAVRTAGFPVSGLAVFGSPDEQSGLRAVACDPLFRTAVTWQNRAAMRNAVAKIAAGAAAPGSRQRQREEVVASYWQRYCAKNDTIGFFGPLAWGRAADDGPAIHASCGQLVSQSTVHFEAWAIQALAEALDPDLTVAVGPQSERDLQAQLERSRPELRDRGLAALGRLERCRSAATSAADPGALDTALGDLDLAFEELTGRSATRRPGQTYAARTLLYLDCMRDLDLTVGPGILGELAATLPPLLAGARWYCGRVYQTARQLIGQAAAAIGTGPLDRVLETVLPALRHHLPDVVSAANGDLQRRWSVLLADLDPATIGARAAAAFADHAPAWPKSVYQSADVQIAAPSLAAVNAGDYLCVVGDFHPGANPLGQGVFATRHPDRDRFLGAIASDVGTLPFLIPPRDVGFHTTRNMPATTRSDDVHIAAGPRDRMPDGYRTLPAAGLITDGQTVTAPDGSWQTPLAHLLWLPLMISAVHGYDPFPVPPGGHGTRITIGRTVWRRETWHIPPAHGPACPEAAASWARDLGLPRRVFMLSPGELKPIYIDFDSPVLTRIMCRQLRRAAAGLPGQPARFTEMLPGPDDCWLADQDGQRYTSELRLVAVDLERRASLT